MKNDYFKDVKQETFVIPSAIDPDKFYMKISNMKRSEKRFFYAGTLDKLREFETVLKHLVISKVQTINL